MSLGISMFTTSIVIATIINVTSHGNWSIGLSVYVCMYACWYVNVCIYLHIHHIHMHVHI